MFRINLQFFGGRGGSSGSGGNTSTNGVPALNNDLIQKANDAGAVFDLGDATQREYNRNVNEIQNMDLTDAEKAKAINDLHELTEEQLEAEAGAKSPYAMGTGPARFNQQQVRKSADNAVKARQKTVDYMEGLRKEQRTIAKQRETQALTTALNDAIKSGALSVTVNGKTYTRKSTRSKTFTT